jgi:hypothetical protein
MIGETIQSRPAPPVGALLFATLAVGADVLAFAQQTAHWAAFSAFPWLAALTLWVMRPRTFRARFTQTALEVEEPPASIPYADVQSLLAPRRPANPFKAGPKQYAIQVLHRDGVLHIPARLSVPSDDVFFFLYRQLPAQGSRAVPAGLRDYLRRKEHEYGPDRVWTYCARAHLGNSPEFGRAAAFLLSLALSGVAWLVWAWLVWGPARDGAGWVAAGIVCIFFGGLFSLLFWLQSRRPPGVLHIKRWHESGLVVTPDGLALAQGDLSGRLRWDEVRQVEIRRRPRAFQYQSGGAVGGIVLKVEGAAIVIADIYDRPLSLIYQQICYYWRGEPAGDGGAWEAFEPPGPAHEIPGTPDSEGIVPTE